MEREIETEKGSRTALGFEGHESSWGRNKPGRKTKEVAAREAARQESGKPRQPGRAGRLGWEDRSVPSSPTGEESGRSGCWGP